MIRVALVDDQTLVRSGIRGLLGLTADISVIGEASNANEACSLIADKQPDVVLMDIRMPGRSGLEVLKELNAAGQLPPTILLTTFDDDGALLEGMRFGARGFLLKDISLERLTDAIRSVAAGNTLFRPAVTERVLQGLRGTLPSILTDEPIETLTLREKEILRLVAAGFNNKEIANALELSEGTIKNHVSSILLKMGVRDRVRAVLKGLELGYI
jgi:DNA-binding NarL/FixJ family response regulator